MTTVQYENPENIPPRFTGPREVRGAVVIRFEDCLCISQEPFKRGNVIDFPVRYGSSSWISDHVNTASEGPGRASPTKYGFSPIEYEEDLKALGKELKWKNSAVWFLKNTVRRADIELFIVSCYPEEVVEKKLARSRISAEILASKFEYDTQSGTYTLTDFVDVERCRSFTQKLSESAKFQEVIFVGGTQQDLPCLQIANGIYMGEPSNRAATSGPGQFSVKNWMEAESVLRAILDGSIHSRTSNLP